MVSQTSLGWFLSEEKFVWLSLGLAIDRNVDQLLEKFSGSFERCVHDARDFWVRCRRWFSDLRSTVEAIRKQPVESGSPFRQITVVYLPLEEHTRKIHLQNVVEAGKNGPQSSLDVIRHPYVRQHWRRRFSLHRPWLNKPNPWMTCLTCRLQAHKVWRRHDLGPFECSQSEDCQFTLPLHNDDDQWTRRRSIQDYSFHDIMSTDQNMRKLGCLHRGERWLDDRRCSCWKKFNLFARLATTWKNQKRGKFWHAFQIWRAAPESQVLDDFFAACARTVDRARRSSPVWSAVSVKNNAPRRSSKKWIERRGPCQCVSWFDGSRVACFFVACFFSRLWSIDDRYPAGQRRQSLRRATACSTRTRKCQKKKGRGRRASHCPRPCAFSLIRKRTMFTRASSPSLCFEARRCVRTLPAELGCGVSCCWRNCFFFPNFRHGEDSPQSPSWIMLCPAASAKPRQGLGQMKKSEVSLLFTNDRR